MKIIRFIFKILLTYRQMNVIFNTSDNTYPKLQNETGKHTMTNEQRTTPHVLTHYIMIDGTNYEIGKHTVYDKYGMINRSEFVNDMTTEDYNFSKIARFQTSGDMEIMMYRIVDRNNGEIFYHVVNNIKLYDENGFLEKIVYDDEFGPDNDVDAYREWATTIDDYI